MDLSQWWPLAGAEDLRQELESAYAGAGRGYHDLRHLAEVFTRLDELAAGGVGFDPATVRLAAWFHDAVYDAQPAAEARSAEWAERSLTGHGLGAETVAAVSRLVRLTEHHRPADDDLDGCALSDADLAILAAPPERYAEYVAGVRREYAALPEEEFNRGRTRVLADLAARPALFHTRHARARWESAARANLARELKALST